jgi:hypothetical protein
VFLADDIVLFPIKSLLSLFREIHNAAMKEIADEADSIRTELGELYLRLETGELDEETFDVRERELLDRLDEIEAKNSEGDEDEDEEGDEEEDDLEDEDEDEDEEDEEEDES